MYWDYTFVFGLLILLISHMQHTALFMLGCLGLFWVTARHAVSHRSHNAVISTVLAGHSGRKLQVYSDICTSIDGFKV